ncbi:MAG TPA: T9SS type A sorting domain-containing protein [Bacteroidales bacterium]|nr:T9SS type A sorting domain-containing protein [Bacteroidales bacterium]
MKKFLLLINVFLLINIVNAQSKIAIPLDDNSSITAGNHQFKTDYSKTQTCVDTLYYALIKESLLSTVDTFYNAYCDYGEMHSQAFIVSSSIQVRGVSIYAQVASGYTAPISMQVFLYNVDANNQPTTQITGASATISVTSNTLSEYFVNFSTPITVTQNFAIVVKNNTSGKRLNVIVNNAKSTSYGEGLSYTYYSSAWYSCESAYGQDFEALFSPIVSYSITSSYTNTPSATTLCLGTPISFNQTSTPTNILTSRFFAFDAFRRYFGLTTDDSTYAWDMVGDGSNLIWQPNHTYTYTNANTYNASLYTISGLWNGCVDVATKVFTIQAPPTAGTISGPTSLCQGYTGTLTLSGSTGASYQWQQSTDGNTWSDISGATTTSYAIPTTLTPGTYYYRVKVGSGGICADVFTSAFQLIISPQPAVGTASVSQTSICYNNPVTLSLSSYSGNLQWMQSTDGTNWTPITGGTTSPFTTPVLTQSTYFKAVVSSQGCNPVESNVLQVTVLTSIGGTASVSGPTSFCDVAPSVVFNLTGYFGSIQWQQSSDGNTWSNISGATSSTYTATNLTTTTHFRAMVTSGSCNEASNVITITVNPSPVAGTASANVSDICQNNTIVLSLSGYTTSANIQWQISTDGGSTWSNINGATYSPFSYLATNIGTLQFRAVVSNNCGSANSNTVIVTVNPAPIAGTANASAQYACMGSSVNISLTGYTPSATIQWQQSTDGLNWTNIPGANNSILNYTATSLGTIHFRAAISNNCGSANSNAVSIIIEAQPSAGNINVNPTVACEGTNINLSLSNYTPGATIQWQQSNDGVNWSNIPGANASLYIYPATTTGIIHFRATVTNNCGSSTSSTQAVTINPAPVSGNASANVSEICLNSNVTLSLIGYSQNSTIQWQQSNDGSTWTNIAGGTTATFVYTPINPGTYYIRAQVTNSCGSQNSNIINLTVNPLPNAGTASASPQSICQNSNITLSLTGYTPLATIQWQFSTDGSSWYNISGANSTPYNYNASTAGTMYFRAIITNNCGNATSNVVSTIVKPLPPTPVISQISNTPVILQSSATLGNQWFNLNGPIPGATSQNYEVTANGTYYVIVTIDGCSSSPSNTITINSVSISEYANHNITVYPNPTNDHLNIISDQHIQKIQLVDILGNIVISTHETSIDVSNYSDGIYQIIILFENDRLIIPVIIQK